ncbi:unnamed protein product [Peniophora sp. CBMAI 1063]|nr:unnamed protein product [Peniophora sp. CBMAI 1063]
MDTLDAHVLPPDIEVAPASEVWLSLARQRLADYHAQMTSPKTPHTSERAAELSRAMRNEARILEHLSKLFVVQWHADAPGIHKLPNEILDYIFSLVAEMDRPCPPYDCRSHSAAEEKFCRLSNNREDAYTEIYPALGSGGYLGWLRLGHVCRSWRASLLGQPALWASDVGILPRGWDAMIERSRNMPLSIRVYSSPCRFEGKAVIDAISRLAPLHPILRQVRELDLIDACSGRLERLDGLFNSCTFPCLRRVAIDGQWRPVQPLLALPKIQAPQLRSLQLSNTFYRWTSSVLSSLTVGDGDDPFAAGLSLSNEHVMYMLQASASSLESLTLCGSLLQEGANPDDQVMPTIALSRLRYLRIDAEILGPGYWERYSRALASVRVPPTARIVLNALSEVDEDVQFTLGTEEIMDTNVDVVTDCLRARQGCNLDGLVISGCPNAVNPGDRETLSFAFYSDANGQLPALDSIDGDSDQPQSSLFMSFRYLTEVEYDPSLSYLLTLHQSDASVLAQLTSMAYMADLKFQDLLGIRRTFSSLLEASTHVRTFALRDAPLSASEDEDVDEDDWHSLMCMLGGPVLPELECLMLYDVVSLLTLRGVLRSRMRAFSECGQNVPKLKELRVYMVDNDAETSDNDTPAVLPPPLYEFADLVILNV